MRIRLLWHPQAQFAGYLVAQHRGIAQRVGIELDCQPIDFAVGPIEAVLAGACEFAVASPSHLLESVAPDELTLLAVIQQTSSLVYPARKSDGVSDPRSLAGKRIGVWPGREDLELRWMLHRLGVPLDTVDFVPVVDTVGALLAGDVSCAQMTTYHEIHELERRAGSLDEFVLFRADLNGGGLVKDGLIGRREWVAQHPERTQQVIDSVLGGWTQAFTAPADAVALCSQLRSDMTPAEHAVQLADIRALSLTGATLSHGLGYPDPQHMLDALEAIAQTDGHRFDLHLATLVDERFWHAAPPSVRASQWA